MRAKAFALCIAALFMLSALATAAEAKGRPAFLDDGHGDKWVLKNDQISLWFQGKKPMLKVFRTGADGNRTGYMLKIEDILEKDASGDVVADVNLEQARPQDWAVSSEQGNASMNLTMAADIEQPGAKGGSGGVTIVFHINSTSSEVKFDVIVEDWQWRSADRENATLALKLLVVNVKLQQKSGNEVSVDDVGYVKWAPTAEADGGTINVTHVIGSEGNAAHIILTFEGSGNASRLEYDPTVGISKATTGKAVSSVGTVAVIVVAAVAAYVLSRRRK